MGESNTFPNILCALESDKRPCCNLVILFDCLLFSLRTSSQLLNGSDSWSFGFSAHKYIKMVISHCSHIFILASPCLHFIILAYCLRIHTQALINLQVVLPFTYSDGLHFLLSHCLYYAISHKFYGFWNSLIVHRLYSSVGVLFQQFWMEDTFFLVYRLHDSVYRSLWKLWNLSWANKHYAAEFGYFVIVE